MPGSDLCIPRNETSRPFKRNNMQCCLLISTYVSVSDYIPTICLPWSDCRNINRSQIHECRNWERGGAVSFLGIYVSIFHYSVIKNKEDKNFKTIMWIWYKIKAYLAISRFRQFCSVRTVSLNRMAALKLGDFLDCSMIELHYKNRQYIRVKSAK